MRRWGDGERFLRRIDDIRTREPDAAFRSSFIVGYPGETERDHDALLEFVTAADLDWAGFFAYSAEEGTYAADLDGEVDAELMSERLAELRELQDGITARRRDALIGTVAEVLVDEPGVGRSHREAPEIDGVISVPVELPVGDLVKVRIEGAAGPDLEATSGVEMASSFGPSALVTPANAVTMGRLVLAPRCGCSSSLWAPRTWPWCCGSCWPPPTASTGTSPGATARPARVRSSIHWPTRPWSSVRCGRSWRPAGSGGCRSRSSPCAKLGISAFRSYWGRRGLAVPASFWAKVKTVVQSVAVGLALLPPSPTTTPGWPPACCGWRWG